MDRDDLIQIKESLACILSILKRFDKVYKAHNPEVGLNPYLTTREAAKYIGISVHTLYAWRRNKRYNIPFVQKARACGYKIEDLDAFMDEYLKWGRIEE